MSVIVELDPRTRPETFFDLLHLYGIGVYKVEEDGKDGVTVWLDVESLGPAWLDILQQSLKWHHIQPEDWSHVKGLIRDSQ